MLGSEPNNTFAKPNVFCGTCRGLITILQARFGESLDIEGPDRPEIHPILATYVVHEVQASGLQGCHICSLVSQAVCPAHSERDIAQADNSKVVVKPRYTRVYAPPYDGTYKLRPFDLRVHLLDSDGNDVNTDALPIITDYDHYSHHPLPASWSFWTGSDATFELARQWLDYCLSGHTLCEEIRASPASNNHIPFPAFLVDVQPGHPIRLRLTKDLPDHPQYLTLSHRWGNTSILKLTSETLTTLLTEINLSDLPKTFQDAIVITRKLGHRFLWIDSLCIIQDSKEHWEQESAIMGDIYRHTACTIAALGATDGNSGCFKTRNPLCFQICDVELGANNMVYLMPAGNMHILSMTTQRTGYGPKVEPLHERAWVMQEWMLSPRTLHYGTLGVFWECATHNSNDRVTKFSDSQPGPKYYLHQAYNLGVSGKLDETFWEFITWWKRVMLMYTPCGMTYNTDRLVAINGVIKFVESKTGLHNLAGLWKEYLFPELLWNVDVVPERRSETYQAPTWSWASLNCSVNPGVPDPTYEFDWKIELLEAVAYPVADNGQLSGAYIKVRGLLQSVHVEKSGNDHMLKWGKEGVERNSADNSIYFLPDVTPNLDQDMWALLIVHATAETSYMNMGLVLTKKMTDSDIWVRIGTFRQYDRPDVPTGFFQDGGAELKKLIIE